MISVDLLGPASASGAVTIRPSETRTFGSADTFFRDCSDPTVDDGTEFNAAWFNAVLANLRSAVRGNGVTGGAANVVTEDNTDDALLLKAIQHMIQRAQPFYADDAGSVNHVIVTLSPAPAELKKGMAVRTRIAAQNSGASDIKVNAFSAVPIKLPDGSALVGGELVVGEMADFEYDGANFQLTSFHAGIATGFRNFVSFTSSGTFVVPAGVSKIYYELWGGGGGGGASSQAGFGAPGGGGGGHVRGTSAVTPGASLPITIGAGGVSGAIPSNGGNGGSTSVGSLATAYGGAGGASVGPGTSTSVSTGGAGGGSGIGQAGNLTLVGQGTYGTTSSSGLGTNGGASFGFPGADETAAGGAAPNGAQGYGAGGSGAPGSVSSPSNAGAPGLVVIWY